MQTLPAGTPRSDNPNILEWVGPQGKVLQYVRSYDYYHFIYPHGSYIDAIYPGHHFTLQYMLELLNI